VAKESLAVTHPDLAAQADGWDPCDVTAGSGKIMPWVCPMSHTWNAKIANRVLGTGCPTCAGRTILVGFNDFATLRPGIAVEAHGWDPSQFALNSHKVVQWKCEKGHEYAARVADRAKGRGCPKCSGRRPQLGETDLATTHPEIAVQADGWDPCDVTAGSSRAFDWKCPKGHGYRSTVINRTKGIGCPVCANKRVLAGFNDISTTDPELSKEAFDWDPTTLTRGSSRRVKWICMLGHIWETSPKVRVRGNNCPDCANQRLRRGFNDFQTMFPELSKEANGWDPREVLGAGGRKLEWRCSNNHTWAATANSRVAGNGCPFCANKLVLRGFNDLQTKYPDIAAQACGWDPSLILPGNSKKRAWLCEAGHEWFAPSYSRISGRGCPTCAVTGYNPNAHGWLYLISNMELGLLQIGITNVPAERLRAHERRGWGVVNLRGPMDGGLAREWEQSILTYLRNAGIQLGPDNQHGNFDGYTEAWRRSDFTIDSLKRLMDLVDESEFNRVN